MTIALVLGGAANVWSDIERALSLGEYDGVITINDITTVWRGEVIAAVSLHGEKWPLWLAQRKKAGLPSPQRIFAHKALRKSAVRFESVITDFVDHLWSDQKDSGSSGLFAAKIALDELGFDKVVLCGVPMTPDGCHYFNAKPWGGAVSHRRGWKQAQHHVENRVKSMSGWTADLLGKPTVDWIINA